ncbi:MAG: SDR family oxidoreductase [Telluria sp.]|nr:SDR family oxidoreductase [Telluria sp.]
MKAVLTGHTRGLGAALASELLGRGIAVLGLARGKSGVCHSLLTEVEIDLGDTAALARWLEADALAGFLQGAGSALLINNAGTVQPVGSLGDQDPGAVAGAVGLNVAAPLMLAAALARIAVAQRRILHISSGAGSSAYPGWSVYCATKAALDQHARAVALDAVKGMRICSLAPGVIDTGMQAEIRATPQARFPMRERFLELKRSGQLVSPADCAVGVIDYLLADRFGERPVDDLRN